MLQMRQKKKKKISSGKIKVEASCLIFEATLAGKSLIEKESLQGMLAVVAYFKVLHAPILCL